MRTYTADEVAKAQAELDTAQAKLAEVQKLWDGLKTAYESDETNRRIDAAVSHRKFALCDSRLEDAKADVLMAFGHPALGNPYAGNND